MSPVMNYSVERKDYLFYVCTAFGGRDDRSKVVRLLVDTGARNTVLPAQFLKECAYDLKSPLRRVRIAAAGGVLQVPIIEISWFNCLGSNIQSFEVIALDLPRSSGIDGLLGMDFLTEIGAIVDIEQMQISVRQKPSQQSDTNYPARAVSILKQLAQVNACATIEDPIAWQNEIRIDRPLPSRDD
jgi:predicted aspartyl protease